MFDQAAHYAAGVMVAVLWEAGPQREDQAAWQVSFGQPSAAASCMACSQLTRLQQFSQVGGALEFGTPRTGGVSTCSSARRAASASSRPVTAAAAASSSSSTQLLPQLQQLSLVGGQIPVSSLQQVSRMTTLTSLKLENEAITKSGNSSSFVSPVQVTAALHSALPQLRDLSELCLVSLEPYVNPRFINVDHSVPFSPLVHVSAMQRLHRLLPRVH
jgi:hypothetical protein